MNTKQIEEFATMKEEVKNIKSTVYKIDNKLDQVLECKLDKQVFENYLKSQNEWIRWVPYVIILVLTLITFFRGL